MQKLEFRVQINYQADVQGHGPQAAIMALQRSVRHQLDLSKRFGTFNIGNHMNPTTTESYFLVTAQGLEESSKFSDDLKKWMSDCFENLHPSTIVGIEPPVVSLESVSGCNHRFKHETFIATAEGVYEIVRCAVCQEPHKRYIPTVSEDEMLVSARSWEAYRK